MSYLKSVFSILTIIVLVNCATNSETPKEVLKVSTPVSVVAIQNSSITELIHFNATSAYQQKNSVKSTITGYIKRSLINQGDVVKAGQPLYTLNTKEGDALTQFTAKDTTLAFKGKLNIASPTSGVIIESNKQTNDYVSDGEVLCTIAVQKSFVFLLNVPFEQNKYAIIGKKCLIILPDSALLQGTITGKLSTVDPASQTQSYILKPITNKIYPENLSVEVQIIKNSKINTQVTDKNCVLSDETMERFWVMKLINDSMAVKMKILPGITSGDKIEILSPIFSSEDRIISKGNYGLADTAFVHITNP
jgi:HlyD family secretion protein